MGAVEEPRPMKLQKSSVRLQVHPVNEALFNLVGAWGMMLLPLMLQDKRAGHVKKKWTIWTATMVSWPHPCRIPASPLQHRQRPPSPCMRTLAQRGLLTTEMPAA